jgi:hypothetical protein
MNGKDQTISISGKDYKISKIDLALLQDFAEWGKTVLADPYAEIMALKDVFGSLPLVIQRELIAKAEQRSATFGTVQDERLLQLMGTLEGGRQVLGLMLARCNPSLKKNELEELAFQGITEHLRDLNTILTTAIGIIEPDESQTEKDFLIESGKMNPDVEKK